MKFEIYFMTTNLLNIARRDDGLKPEMEDIELLFDQTFSNFYEITGKK